MVLSHPSAEAGDRVRALFPTSHSDLRVTWHRDEDLCVLSMWREGTCVASAQLSPRDAARLATHLVAELGERGA